MEVENDRFVQCEQAVEITIRKAMRMLGARHQSVEIDHVDKADFEIRESFRATTQPPPGLPSWEYRRRSPSPDPVRAVVVAGLRQMPMPLVQCSIACVHIQVLQMLLLVAHNHINIVGAFQAMIGDTKQVFTSGGR